VEETLQYGLFAIALRERAKLRAFRRMSRRMTDLEKYDYMEIGKRSAFRGLFHGARLYLTVFTSPEGKKTIPMFGKAECEHVEDWEDFYSRELPQLGWIKFEWIGEPRIALGMRDGWTYVNAKITITDAGFEVMRANRARNEEANKIRETYSET
jgi:hypothetical protein